MIVTLKAQGLQTLEQIRAFLAGSAPLSFAAPQREAAYGFIAAQLCHFGYLRLGKADKGLVHRYLCKVTGISRAQMTRLIAQYRATGRVVDRRGPPAQPFARRYTPEDVRFPSSAHCSTTPSKPISQRWKPSLKPCSRRPCAAPGKRPNARRCRRTCRAWKPAMSRNPAAAQAAAAR